MNSDVICHTPLSQRCPVGLVRSPLYVFVGWKIRMRTFHVSYVQLVFIRCLYSDLYSEKISSKTMISNFACHILLWLDWYSRTCFLGQYYFTLRLCVHTARRSMRGLSLHAHGLNVNSLDKGLCVHQWPYAKVPVRPNTGGSDKFFACGQHAWCPNLVWMRIS